jgi:hypothetical protein
MGACYRQRNRTMARKPRHPAISDFDWQVADEQPTAPAPAAAEQAPPAKPHHLGRWLVLAAALLVLGAAGGWLYGEARQRTEVARRAAEAEILGSHRLLLQAVAARDRELATNLLSGRDRAWAAQQRARIEAGTLLSEPGLGLVASGEEEAVSWLAPALDEATVVMTQTVRFAGEDETGRLARTWLYRRGQGGWLYAPPPDPAAYWGERRQQRLERLSIQFPARDEALATRLAAAMEAALAQACVTLACPDDLEMVVVLATQPGSMELPALDSLEQLVFGRGALYLPAPSLIGEPVDEAGFNLLARAYIRPLLVAALGRELWSWRCCDHAPLYEALLDAQLAQWGVQPWPPAQEHYQYLLERDFRLFEDAMASWYGQAFSPQRDLAWLQAHAVVAFLLAENPGADLGALAAALNEAPSTWHWAFEFLGERVGDSELQARWEAFARRQAGED